MFKKGYLKCAMWMNEMTFLDLNRMKWNKKESWMWNASCG
jgi:hypothetical protein